MADRPFDAQSIIQLPRLNADETHTAVQQLTAEAAAVPGLPGGISDALAEMKASDARLLAAMASKGRAEAKAAIDPNRARAADKFSDCAWGGTRSWLEGFEELPEAYQPDPQAVRTLKTRLFGDGSGFLAQPFKEQWAECDRRLLVIAEEGLAPLFTKLGGDGFLRALKDSHAEYGAALHVTAAAPWVAPDLDVRGPMQECQYAIRFYATQVVASIKPKDPATRERADRLLRPLIEWKSEVTPAPAATPI
ncbi:MAG: hypothetical protein HY904_23750 [Deltaproteobacteria bacterium]|nr:hypothetical protein [Deltaproteobacteria bacterium]